MSGFIKGFIIAVEFWGIVIFICASVSAYRFYRPVFRLMLEGIFFSLNGLIAGLLL